MNDSAAGFTPATTEQWREAYQAKIDDLARETQRTSALSAVARRLYETLASEWNALDRSQEARRRFFLDGMPDSEREALFGVLDDAERAWLADA